MKKLSILFVLTLLFFAFPISAFASSNFSTTYNVIYKANESGITHATFSISLKNLSHDFYASSYSLKIGFNSITNVHASDPDGEIAPDVKKINDGYLISLTFNKKVVGFNKILPFSFSFDTTDVAKKEGELWEINIPGIGSQENFEDIHVHVSVPPSFGTPTFIKPQVANTNLDFTKEDLGKSGISITFGKRQIYDLSLQYDLENKNLFPLKETIAVPPSTNYQDIYILFMDPKPMNVEVDADGNWLATYYLPASKKTHVTVKGKAYLSLTPKQEILSAVDAAKYLQEEPYWQTSDSRIQQLAKQLQTPYNIYDYVRRNLTYDFSRVSTQQKRLGAKAVLTNPKSAVCLEFTDLFITLARGAGISARELDGFAYTQNTKQRPLSLIEDVLHAWPEYYDKEKQEWIMVDPTWSNTTGGIDYFNRLDFDHVAFVIKGVNSTYPIPAGGYKITGQENVKDVDVHFGEDTAKKDPLVAFSYTLPTTTFSLLKIKGNFIVRNTAEALAPMQTIAIDAQSLSPHHQEITVPPIPPFGSTVIPFGFYRTPFLTNQKMIVTMRFAQATYTKTITVYPIFEQKYILGGVIFGTICIIIFIIAARARRISFFR